MAIGCKRYQKKRKNWARFFRHLRKLQKATDDFSFTQLPNYPITKSESLAHLPNFTITCPPGGILSPAAGDCSIPMPLPLTSNSIPAASACSRAVRNGLRENPEL